MGPFIISLMLAAGVAGFLWAKLSHSTGNADPKTLAITAAAIFVGVFIVAFTLMKFVIHIG